MRHRRPPWCTQWLLLFQHRKLQMSPWVEIQAIEFHQIFQHKPKGSALQTFQGRTRRETGEDEQQAKDKIAEHCQTCEHGNPLNMNSQREFRVWYYTGGCSCKKIIFLAKSTPSTQNVDLLQNFQRAFAETSGSVGFHCPNYS